MVQNSKLEEIASQVRRDIVRMVGMAGSGHPGGSLSSTELMVTLFFKEMNHTPGSWSRDGKGVDIFFLSAGHLSPLYYSVLARSGYFPVSELASFRKLGSRLQGHPSTDKGLPGVHIATGSLGQGLSVACGAAIAKKMNREENFVYALLGDGECEEGQVWEAALFAAHQGLNKLIAFVDWNGQQIDGPVESILNLGDLKAKWEAFGWNCMVVDGHDTSKISSAIEYAKGSINDGKPSMILLKTSMGKGVDFMAGTHHWHGKAPNAQQVEEALAQLPETLGDF